MVKIILLAHTAIGTARNKRPKGGMRSKPCARDTSLRTGGRDQLRAAKAYFEVLDYYQGALSQKPNSAVLYNKLGINELLSARYQQAQKDFERATKLDAGYADAFNNLGVLEYLRRRYGRAIKQYQRAIGFDPDDAS